MNAEFRVALKGLVEENPNVSTDLVLYDLKTEPHAADDMLSVSLVRTLLSLNPDFSKVKELLDQGDIESLKAICSKLKDQMISEHGIKTYAALWAVNCLLFACGVSFYFTDDSYRAALEKATESELEQLANKGDAYAAVTLFIRDSGKKDMLESAIKLDYPAAYYHQAEALTDDTSNDSDHLRALELYTKAYEMGYIDACSGLAKIYSGVAGIDKDPKRAFEYALIGANAGSVKCLLQLADAYEDGDGVEKDEAKAFTYYEKAAKAGESWAQIKLGLFYDEGTHGCEVDHQTSFMWFKRSVDAGNPTAYCFVGLCYQDGEGVEKNIQEAIKYYNLAAENGDTDAMEKLGGIYFAGEGVPKDEEKSATWYKKAADSGSGFACSMLATFYRGGIGVARNLARADQYDKKAKELGYEEEGEEEDASNVDLNDPAAQAKVRAFATEALEMMGYEDHTETEYADDDWDLGKIGNGDGITEIRDEDLKELFRVMRDTWNAFASVTEKRGLDLYKDQGRYYMYMLSKLAIELLNKKIDNFAYYLLNFLYGSSCSHYMGDSASDNFNNEFTACSETFDNIHHQGHNLAETMMIYLYSVNLHQGNYSNDIAREVSVEQVQYTTQFLSTVGSIAEKRHMD